MQGSVHDWDQSAFPNSIQHQQADPPTGPPVSPPVTNKSNFPASSPASLLRLATPSGKRTAIRPGKFRAINHEH